MTDTPLWFYAAGTEQKGPFTAEQMATLLTAGVILPETLVWSAGMAAWTPLAQTPLSPAAADPTVAPPLPASGAGSIDSILEAVKFCFQNYATFSGRARRPEFWYFLLFNWLVGLLLAVIDTQILGFDGTPLSGLYSLAVFLPNLAVLVRRLHDTDRSGWLALLYMVPIIGWIVLIVFCAQESARGRNRYG